MTEALSTAAGIVGITVPALHGVRLLLDDIQRIIDAPSTVKSLEAEVLHVQEVLALLQTVKNEDWESLGAGIADHTKAIVSSCTTTCDRFRADIQRWTRHSRDGKLSWHSQAKLGFFKQDLLRSISNQLQNCKVTINSVISIATLYLSLSLPVSLPVCGLDGTLTIWFRYSSIRNTQITVEINESLSARRDELTAATRTADTQLEQVVVALEDANDRDDTETYETVSLLTEEQRALFVTQSLLRQLLSKIQDDAVSRVAAERPSQTTYMTVGDHNTGILMATNYAPISGVTFGVQQ